MDVLKNALVQSGLNALDPKPVNVSRADYYLSSLVCKNLSDLCDTGAAILESLNRPQNDTELPNKSLIQLASDTLKMSAMNDMEMKILTNVGTFSELITFYTWHEILAVVLPDIILKVTLHLGIILEFYPEVFVNYLPSEIFAGLIYIALISYNYKWLDSLDSYLSVTELKAVEVAQYIYQLINEKRLIKNLQEYKVLLPELKVDIVSP